MQAFWLGVIAILWSGFFVLEGFDFGVGVLLPFVGRNDLDRRVALRSIGPVWDGNEVWLLVAGGATFAAFPEWYASVFSGFYLAFVLLLAGLILRGIGIEYRSKAETAKGRSWCDGAIVVGSLLPALLLGVAFADFIRGVKMDSGHNMTGGFFDLITPYGLLGGVVTLTLFAFHGAVFLALRTEGPVTERAEAAVRTLTPVTGAAAVAFIVWTAFVRGGGLSIAVGILVAVLFLVAAGAARARRWGYAFTASAVTAALVPPWVFTVMWPNVLPARNNSALSLTIHNASSSPYTLRVMTVVALVFTPIVLVYQAWAYWVFRARVTGETVTGGDGYGLVGRTVAKAHESLQSVTGGTHPPAADAAPTTGP